MSCKWCNSDNKRGYQGSADTCLPSVHHHTLRPGPRDSKQASVIKRSSAAERDTTLISDPLAAHWLDVRFQTGPLIGLKITDYTASCFTTPETFPCSGNILLPLVPGQEDFAVKRFSLKEKINRGGGKENYMILLIYEGVTKSFSNLSD